MKKYYINIALRAILCASLVLLVSIGNSSYAYYSGRYIPITNMRQIINMIDKQYHDTKLDIEKKYNDTKLDIENKLRQRSELRSELIKLQKRGERFTDLCLDYREKSLDAKKISLEDQKNALTFRQELLDRRERAFNKKHTNTLKGIRIGTMVTAVVATGAALWRRFKSRPRRKTQGKAELSAVDKAIEKSQITEKQANKMIYAVVACTLILLFFLYSSIAVYY